MKKLSIIAAWLCALMYFGIQAQAVAFSLFSGPDPGSKEKRLSIGNLKDCKSFCTIPADTCFQSVTLSTQAEVDAFSCVVLVGRLAISGSDITGLEPLSRIGDGDNLANFNVFIRLKRQQVLTASLLLHGILQPAALTD